MLAVNENGRWETEPASAPGAPVGLRARRSDLRLALCLLIAAFIHPPHGLGLPLCPSRVITGAPCPGCGLSRSVSCAVRGMWAESFAYHPFGIAVVALAILIVLHQTLVLKMFVPSPIPRRWMRVFWFAFVAAFIVFGTLRMLGVFPWPDGVHAVVSF